MSAQTFSSPSDFIEHIQSAEGPDAAARDAATARNGLLTKPAGALGRLEDIAIWYAAWRGEAAPMITAPQVVIFAGNHGVTAQGISAFPAEVTAQMVMNFEQGGAAINQLAKLAGANLNVVSLDLDTPTADFTVAPAMSEAELLHAISTGWNAVEAGSDLFVAGEMGIGNTTAAAALALALFGGEAGDWAGRGTGLDLIGVAHKADVIDRAVKLHNPSTPLEALASVGGRELAAMSGAIASARNKRIPVILDGFIASTSAAVLHQIDPKALDHVVAGHVSEEAAHGAILERLGKEPLLNLGLRLGEGSGAALAIQIVKAALACHSGMATFDQAGVSEG